MSRRPTPVAWSREATLAMSIKSDSSPSCCITKATSRVGAGVCQDDLDEIFSELCLNLVRDDMKKLRAFDPGRNVKVSTWLGMLAINTAYDHLRKRARFPLLAATEERAPEPACADPDPLDNVLDSERHEMLRWHR